jgi:hypothetical protein
MTSGTRRPASRWICWARLRMAIPTVEAVAQLKRVLGAETH